MLGRYLFGYGEDGKAGVHDLPETLVRDISTGPLVCLSIEFRQNYRSHDASVSKFSRRSEHFACLRLDRPIIKEVVQYHTSPFLTVRNVLPNLKSYLEGRGRPLKNLRML